MLTHISLTSLLKNMVIPLAEAAKASQKVKLLLLLQPRKAVCSLCHEDTSYQLLCNSWALQTMATQKIGSPLHILSLQTPVIQHIKQGLTNQCPAWHYLALPWASSTDTSSLYLVVHCSSKGTKFVFGDEHLKSLQGPQGVTEGLSPLNRVPLCRCHSQTPHSASPLSPRSYLGPPSSPGCFQVLPWCCA